MSQTNRADYGVKFRSYDGKQNLEFKFLEDNSGSIDNPAPAKIKNWVKWSLPLPEEFNETWGRIRPGLKYAKYVIS